MQESYKVIDMHCDLLSYLADGAHRTPLDPQSNASLPQIAQGGVILQVMAIYTSNKPSAPLDLRQQLRSFLELYKQSSYVAPLASCGSIETADKGKAYILPSFENAVGFAEESESIVKVIDELSKTKKLLGPIAYISMTWDGENRFGGGVGSTAGLKSDGERLLEWMNEKHIPVDVSHASDFLIDDILNCIDKKGYSLPLIASHSNFRKITQMQRNLPDDMAKEIIARKGLIGLNFFCHFSGGKKAKDLLDHITHAIELKGEDSLCLGADFFYDKDLPYIKQKYQSDKCFYPELSNSSCYPWLLSHCKDTLSLSNALINKISHINAKCFLEKTLSIQKTR